LVETCFIRTVLLMRKTIFPLLVFSLILVLTGCGRTGGQTQPSSPAAGRVNTGSTSPQLSNSPGSLIIEPDYGSGPYLTVIYAAKHSIDVNSYLLTDHDLVNALIKQAEAGVNVRVIVAGNPYGDSQAVPQERAGFAGSRVLLKLAPAQFEGRYVYDHAKYLVTDPGQGGRAIPGSSNMDYSGLGGGNREYDYDTTDPAVVANMEAIFDADWNGQSLRLSQPDPLIISPGSESQLVSLIEGASRRLDIESEEMGNDHPVLDAIIAAARRGVQVEVVLPAGVSEGNRRNAAELSRAGAKVRYLGKPYPHAKLFVVDDQVFLGSQNISVSSLDRNREVGIVVTGDPVSEAATTFERDFAVAGE